MKLTAFPPEIILNIFRFLTPSDLFDIASVNRSWSVLGRNDTLWRNHVLQLLRTEQFPENLLDIAHDDGKDWFRLYHQFRDFLFVCTSDEERAAKLSFAWGPGLGDLWVLRSEPQSLLGRAMFLESILWWFSAGARKRVHAAGSFGVFWHMMLDDAALINDDLFFSVRGPNVTTMVPLSVQRQEELRGKGWFFVLLPEIVIPEGDIEVNLEAHKHQGGIKRGFWIDYVAMVPFSCILESWTRGDSDTIVVPIESDRSEAAESNTVGSRRRQ